jgi:hypothetical protein
MSLEFVIVTRCCCGQQQSESLDYAASYVSITSRSVEISISEINRISHVDVKDALLERVAKEIFANPLRSRLETTVTQSPAVRRISKQRARQRFEMLFAEGDPERGCVPTLTAVGMVLVVAKGEGCFRR